MKVALLGLRQSGKKTFFRLLTGCAETALSALGPEESLERPAPVQDGRLEKLAEMFKARKIKFAENAIVLCPAIDPKKTDRAWMEPARRCDLICLVVRNFSSNAIYHPEGSVEPERDFALLEAELLLADLELIEKRLERISKEKHSGKSPAQALEEQTLNGLKDNIENDAKAGIVLETGALESVQSLGLFALKPILAVFNVDEDNAGDSSSGLAVSCLIESEIMDLDSGERGAYLKDLGLDASGIERFNRAVCEKLGIISFYAVAEEEAHAWTIRKGLTAPEAAGKVHSDIERGFIRAEIIKFEDMVACGSEAECKARGKILVRGRDYIIEDGDICHFRFNV